MLLDHYLKTMLKSELTSAVDVLYCPGPGAKV